MLKKITSANKKDPYRLWYSDGYFDLIIWYNTKQSIKVFQLCYDIAVCERILSWSQEYGFRHSQIDSGEQNPTKNQSPLCVADGIFEKEDIIEKFKTNSKNIEREIREFIIEKIATYQ